jgi:hypothetical protein
MYSETRRIFTVSLLVLSCLPSLLPHLLLSIAFVLDIDSMKTWFPQHIKGLRNLATAQNNQNGCPNVRQPKAQQGILEILSQFPLWGLGRAWGGASNGWTRFVGWQRLLVLSVYTLLLPHPTLPLDSQAIGSSWILLKESTNRGGIHPQLELLSERNSHSPAWSTTTQRRRRNPVPQPWVLDLAPGSAQSKVTAFSVLC